MSDDTARQDGGVYQIGHLFADHGVESEALAAYGDVYRFTIDPEPNGFIAETTAMDLMQNTPDADLDLAVLHPKCAKYCDMPNVDPSDHEDQIPRAREIAEEIASDYVIENKPRAPLDDPVILNGRMFGLPLAYERAFETSFPVEQPATQETFGKTVSPYFYSDRTAEWWRGVKGYAGDYPKQHLAKNALPAAYVHHICRSWLESRDTRDAEEPQDNNSRAPREKPDDQATLLTDGGRDTYGDEIEHKHDVGAVLEKTDSSEWAVTNRMVDVDTEEKLYRLRDVDSKFNDAEVLPASQIARCFEGEQNE